MLNEKWLDLQLFAGEGAGDGGGEAAATGENNADAGHQRLRELGVPEAKIRKNRAYKLPASNPKPAENVQTQEAGQEVKQAAAATDPAEEKTDDMDFDKSAAETIANLQAKVDRLEKDIIRYTKIIDNYLG